MSEVTLYVPDVGETDSIELVNWLVAEGAEVSEGQELAELVTDKAAFSLEAPNAGKLQKIIVSKGNTVEPGAALALLQIS